MCRRDKAHRGWRRARRTRPRDTGHIRSSRRPRLRSARTTYMSGRLRRSTSRARTACTRYCPIQTKCPRGTASLRTGRRGPRSTRRPPSRSSPGRFRPCNAQARRSRTASRPSPRNRRRRSRRTTRIRYSYTFQEHRARTTSCRTRQRSRPRRRRTRSRPSPRRDRQGTASGLKRPIWARRIPPQQACIRPRPSCWRIGLGHTARTPQVQQVSPCRVRTQSKRSIRLH